MYKLWVNGVSIKDIIRNGYMNIDSAIIDKILNNLQSEIDSVESDTKTS